MKCHYIYDKIAGKVLIPGCWGTVHSNDIKDCYCNSLSGYIGYEERISKLEQEVKDLKKLTKNLNSV